MIGSDLGDTVRHGASDHGTPVDDRNFPTSDFARSFIQMTISVAFHAWSERPATPRHHPDGGAYWDQRNVKAVLITVPQRSSLRGNRLKNKDAVAEAFRVRK